MLAKAESGWRVNHWHGCVGAAKDVLWALVFSNREKQ
jgi:hypothetical protein